ncbi:hypothetical protein [Streptomyces sp. NPDC001978]|uniref:hypothetical protein n=1 Tax=Streptomyces sp. NPDC001978 TaxID=3364627 RepID=UPI0036A8CD42
MSVSQAAEVLPGYGQCASTPGVSWLADDNPQMTIQPGASAKLVVTLDANVPAISQPGSYTATLTVGAKTPYRMAPVTVTLTVNPPKSWGKITGTVAGAACSAASSPLAGATVRINSGKANYTLKTDSSGQYVLWLDTRNNPLTLIAAKDGWAP